MVMSLDDSGPAKAAGLHVGDIIVAWNGEPVEGPRGLMRRLGPDSAGTQVKLDILRGGSRSEVVVTIGEKPLVVSEPPLSGRLELAPASSPALTAAEAAAAAAVEGRSAAEALPAADRPSTAASSPLAKRSL